MVAMILHVSVEAYLEALFIIPNKIDLVRFVYLSQYIGDSSVSISNVKKR